MQEVDTSGTAKYAEADAVIRFWRDAGPKMWFAKDAAFDAEFYKRFGELHFAAARRERDAWQEDPYGSLALVLLLDQFPRNCFRGTAHMFATDSLARYYAHEIIDSGKLKHLEEGLRAFVYVPFMHSEALEDQEYAVSLYTNFAPDDLKWALEHRDIIQRFGRFPHRNPSLGRDTTPEERAFLDGGGFAG